MLGQAPQTAPQCLNRSGTSGTILSNVCEGTRPGTRVPLALFVKNLRVSTIPFGLGCLAHDVSIQFWIHMSSISLVSTKENGAFQLETRVSSYALTSRAP